MRLLEVLQKIMLGLEAGEAAQAGLYGMAGEPVTKEEKLALTEAIHYCEKLIAKAKRGQL